MDGLHGEAQAHCPGVDFLPSAWTTRAVLVACNMPLDTIETCMSTLKNSMSDFGPCFQGTRLQVRCQSSSPTQRPKPSCERVKQALSCAQQAIHMSAICATPLLKKPVKRVFSSATRLTVCRARPHVRRGTYNEVSDAMELAEVFAELPNTITELDVQDILAHVAARPRPTRTPLRRQRA